MRTRNKPSPWVFIPFCIFYFGLAIIGGWVLVDDLAMLIGLK